MAAKNCMNTTEFKDNCEPETRDVSCIERHHNELDERLSELSTSIRCLIQRIRPVSRSADSVPCEDNAKDPVECNESHVSKSLRMFIRICNELNCDVAEAIDLLEI